MIYNHKNETNKNESRIPTPLADRSSVKKFALVLKYIYRMKYIFRIFLECGMISNPQNLRFFHRIEIFYRMGYPAKTSFISRRSKVSFIAI